MSLHTRTCFEFTKPQKIEKLLDKLVEHFNLQLVDDTRRRVQWLDTFDWQLYKAGLSLSSLDENNNHTLRLQQLPEGDIIAQQPIATTPLFADELPPSRLSKHLPSAFPPRALLPQARQSETTQIWALLDEEKKTRARIEYHAIKPMVNGATPLPLLVLVQLRGYENDAGELYKWLSNRGALQQLTFDRVYERAFQCTPRQPGVYSSKFSLGLDKQQTTDSALRDILRHLLENIEANIPGTIADTDSEFLHDLRVAVRRSRSALTRIKGVFPPSAVEKFNQELRWIGSITGTCRDLDVHLLALPNMQNHLPSNLRSSLQAFENYLHSRKTEEHGRLAELLRSPRMLDFLTEWRSFLNESPEGLTDTGAKTVQQTAGAATWKMYRRVIRDGQALTTESPAEHFHELRKDMKKLRYLMELFASLYPGKIWKQQLKLQKALQNILGDFQDLEVQAEAMLDNGRALYARDDTTAETLMALGILSEQLREQQAHSLDHFEDAFAELAGEDCRKTFKKLCANPGKGGAK